MPRTGPLAKNFILDDAERLYDGHLKGPESIASRAKNEVFVSLHNGDIARVWGTDFDKSEIVTKIGPGCGKYIVVFENVKYIYINFKYIDIHISKYFPSIK